jgi:hypothetical protein
VRTTPGDGFGRVVVVGSGDAEDRFLRLTHLEGGLRRRLTRLTVVLALLLSVLGVSASPASAATNYGINVNRLATTHTTARSIGQMTGL